MSDWSTSFNYSIEQEPTPITLTAEEGIDNIELHWTPTNSNRVVQYRVSRASDSMGFSPIFTTTETTYYDNPPSLNTDYCYWIEALRADNSVLISSNPACASVGGVELWVPHLEGITGKNIIIPLRIQNARGLRIGAADLWLDYDPAVLDIISIERTPLTDGYVWAKNVLSVGDLERVKISSTSSDPPVLYGEGDLFWLKAQVLPNSITTTLDLKEFVQNIGGSLMFSPDDYYNPIPITLYDGIFQNIDGLDTFILGDVDNNGVVELIDAQVVLNLAVGILPTTVQQLRAGDINGNNILDAGDAAMIRKFVLTGTWPQAPARSIFRSTTGNPLVKLNNLSGISGDTIQLTVDAENLTSVSGMDFAINYDPMVIDKVLAITGTGLAEGADIAFKSEDGLLRISLLNTTSISGTGHLATITLQVSNNEEGNIVSSVTLADVKMYDVSGRDFATSAIQQTVERQNGLMTITSSPAISYTLSGHVSNSFGQGLPGVSVWDDAGHSTTTDDNGDYRLDGLVNGYYQISVARDDEWFLPDSLIVYVNNADVPNQNFKSHNIYQVYLPLIYK